MRLYVDLDTLGWFNTGSFRSPVAGFALRRGDLVTFEVQFLKGGVVTDLGTPTLQFALKEPGKYDATPAALVTSWTKTGSGTSAYWAGIIDTTSDAIAALLYVDGDSANDLAAVTLMGALRWAYDAVDTESSALAVVVANNIVRDNEPRPIVSAAGQPLLLWASSSTGAAYTQQADAVTVSTWARASNVLTVNTAAAHGLSAGDAVQITGEAAINGTYSVVSVTDADTFTVAQTGSNTTAGSSTASSRRLARTLYGVTTAGLPLGTCALVDVGAGVLTAYVLLAGTTATSLPASLRGYDYASSTNERYWSRATLAATTAWADVTSKPSTFAPSAHASSHASDGADPITVAQSQVTGLSAALADKADLTGGKVPDSQLPEKAFTGVYSLSASPGQNVEAALAAATFTRADVEGKIVYVSGGTDVSLCLMLVDPDELHAIEGYKVIGKGPTAAFDPVYSAGTLAAARSNLRVSQRIPTYSLGPTTGSVLFQIERPPKQVPFDSTVWGSTTIPTGYGINLRSMALQIQAGTSAVVNTYAAATARVSAGYHRHWHPGTNGSYMTFTHPWYFWIELMCQDDAPGLETEFWIGCDDSNVSTVPSNTDRLGLRWTDRTVRGCVHNGATATTHVSEILGYTNSGINYGFLACVVPGTGIWFQLSSARNADYTGTNDYGNAADNHGAWITSATHGSLVTSVAANTTLRVRSVPTASLAATKTREFSNLIIGSSHEDYQGAHPFSF